MVLDHLSFSSPVSGELIFLTKEKRAQCTLTSNKCIILSHNFSLPAKDRGTLSSPKKSLHGQEEFLYGKQSDK